MLSAIKNFGVTFIISIVIFGIIAYFATGFVTGTVTDILDSEHEQLGEIINNPDNIGDDTDETDDNPVVDPEKELYGDSFNFIIVTTDYRPDVYETYLPTDEQLNDERFNDADPTEMFGYLSSDYRKTNVTSIVIVRIDKEKEQVLYSYITPQMRVFTSSGYRSLSQVYDLYGVEKLTEYINGLTGLSYKYTMLIDGYNMDELSATVGTVSVGVGKNIYNDGKYHTFNAQTEYEVVDEFGDTWTEYSANAFVLGAGSITLDADGLYNSSAVIEHSAADLSAKQSIAIETARAYLSYLAGLEEEDLKTCLAQLVLEEDLWESIPDILSTIERPEPEETDTGNTDLPFDINPVETDPYVPPVETDPETEEPETEPEETEDTDETVETDEFGDPIIEEPEEETKLFEPDTPILQTNFTIEEFYEIFELLTAVNKFENKVITYPCTYVPADEEHGEYFDYDVAKGAAMYSEYRVTSNNK